MNTHWRICDGLSFTDSSPFTRDTNVMSKFFTALAIAAYAQLPEKNLRDALTILAYSEKYGGLSCEFNGWVYVQSDAVAKVLK